MGTSSAAAIQQRKFSFQAPYKTFWFAALGLALEGVAGEARRFVAPVSSTPDFAQTTILSFVTFICLALVVFMALKRKNEFVFKSKAWAVVVAILFSGGLAFFYQERLFISSASHLCVYGYLLASLAGVLYFLIWFDRIFPYGLKAALETVAVSIILRGIFQIVLLLLQETPAAVLLMALPLISLYFYLRIHRENDTYLDEGALAQNKKYLIVGGAGFKRHAAFASFLAVAFALAFLMNSEGSQQLLTPSSSNVPLGQLSCVMGNLIGGIVMFGASQTSLNKSSLFIFVVIVVGFTCIGLYSSISSTLAGSVLSSVFLSAARKCIDLLVVLPAFIFSLDGRPRYAWYALTRLVGNFASYLAAATFTYQSSESAFSGTSSIIGLIILFAAFITFFACTNDGAQADSPALKTTQPEVAKPQEEQPVRRPFREALEQVAQEAGLTPTETTVFNLIARGHNAESVRQELTVSINTAKTHIRNIYAKLNVHSQQELLERVEQAKKELSEEANGASRH